MRISQLKAKCYHRTWPESRCHQAPCSLRRYPWRCFPARKTRRSSFCHSSGGRWVVQWKARSRDASVDAAAAQYPLCITLVALPSALDSNTAVDDAERKVVIQFMPNGFPRRPKWQGFCCNGWHSNEALTEHRPRSAPKQREGSRYTKRRHQKKATSELKWPSERVSECVQVSRWEDFEPVIYRWATALVVNWQWMIHYA